MTTPNPQQEYQKLAYLKVLGVQPWVLVRQPGCGAMLPRAVPDKSGVRIAPETDSIAANAIGDLSSESNSAGGNSPSVNLAAVRESLMGDESAVASGGQLKSADNSLGNNQGAFEVHEEEQVALESTTQMGTSEPSVALPAKFTALIYAHAHVTLVAVGEQFHAAHWALSKNISHACHAEFSSQSDTAALPSVLEFHWPIPGVSSANTDAAQSAFAGFLTKHTAQGDTRILLLGDLSQQLAQVFVNRAPGKQILVGPSLDAMLTDQSLKRSLWQDLIANGFA
jgi:hypothetical protein